MTLRSFDHLIAELDRCQHGRHAADPCFGCPEGNQGNPFLVPGTRIGTTLYGQPIMVPEFDRRYDPKAWVGEVPLTEAEPPVPHATQPFRVTPR